MWWVVALSPFSMMVQAFPPSEAVQGGGDCAFGTTMLKVSASFFSASFCYSPGYGMGMYGAGF